MIFIVILFTFLVVVPIALAVPPALQEKSGKRFCIALLLSFFGIVLPLFYFLASSVLTPNCKSFCRFGWLDCFITGKLVLTPLVLWASLALYALDIYRVKTRDQAWIVLGIFTGAVVSCLCCVFGFLCLTMERGDIIMMAVPVYIALWFLIRAVLLIRASSLRFGAYLAALVVSTPFWAGGLIWSYLIFAPLPEKPPDCFLTPPNGQHQALAGCTNLEPADRSIA